MTMLFTNKGGWSGIFLALIIAAGLSGCAGYGGRNEPDSAPGLFPGSIVGYLSSEAIPSSLALLPLPPPPARPPLRSTRISAEEVSLYAIPRAGSWLFRTPICDFPTRPEPTPAPWIPRSPKPKHHICTGCCAALSPTSAVPPPPPSKSTFDPVHLWSTTSPCVLRMPGQSWRRMVLIRLAIRQSAGGGRLSSRRFHRSNSRQSSPGVAPLARAAMYVMCIGIAMSCRVV